MRQYCRPRKDNNTNGIRLNKFAFIKNFNYSFSFSLLMSLNVCPPSGQRWDQSARNDETESTKHAHSFSIAVKLNKSARGSKMKKKLFCMFSVYNTKLLIWENEKAEKKVKWINNKKKSLQWKTLKRNTHINTVAVAIVDGSGFRSSGVHKIRFARLLNKIHFALVYIRQWTAEAR